MHNYFIEDGMTSGIRRHQALIAALIALLAAAWAGVWAGTRSGPREKAAAP